MNTLESTNTQLMIFEQTVAVPVDGHIHLDFIVPKELFGTETTFKVVPQPMPRNERNIPETMLLSEASLAKDWNTDEEDVAWQAL